MESKIAYLQTIQIVINRLASNSFLLKGWSVTIVVALFALAAAETNKLYVGLAYFPVLMFWALDAYYLGQERRYIDLYDAVRQKDSASIDFSLHTERFNHRHNSFFSALFSKTVLFFHGAVIASLLVVTFVFK